MLGPGCLSAALLIALLVVLPLFFAELVVTALQKLALPPDLALLAVLGIFLGSMINLPVKRYERDVEVQADPLAIFGLGRLVPRFRRVRRQTILAVNVGGCVVPCLIVVYELARIGARGGSTLLAAALATGATVAVCYRLARPVEGVGIAMPALVPPLVAAIAAVLLAPDFAPPVAFVAGVLGPLVGADLLHLDEVKRIATGMASIGGAGTFDGIVLSGLIATVLA